MKKPQLDPNPERHRIRSELASRRRETYKLWFHVRAMKDRGLVPKADKVNKLRTLRRECRRLSRLLHSTPTHVKIRGGEETWNPGSFRRFRHSARGTRWEKVRLGWKLRV